MKKYKIRMIISILVIVILLIYMALPMFSMADNEELIINLTKVEINGEYKINITGSSPSKVKVLSYINEKKTVADFNNNAEAIIAKFEGNDATKIDINNKNEKYIDETIDVKNFGDYTIYLRNEDGEIQLSYITIREKAEINLTAVSQESKDSKSILINASSTSNIMAVKVIKSNDAMASTNFTNATNVLGVPGTPVEITYPILENGTYQVYVEDANKNKKIQTVNVFDGETPISIDTVVNGTSVTIKVKDCIANIQTIKIAPKSEISAIADFETKGTKINFEGTNDITVNYNVQTQGEYVIFAKNTAGNAYMKGVNISNTPNQEIKFYKLENQEDKIYAVATNSINNISLGKYMLSQEQPKIDDIKQNGTEIRIEQGKTVVLEITSSSIKNSKFISVYIKDIVGYGKMVGVSINAIETVNKIPGAPEQQQQPTIPEQQQQQPTIPEQQQQPIIPEQQQQQPTIPEQQQQPTIPEQQQQPTIPEQQQQPTIPEQQQQPTIPEQQQQPTIPEQQQQPTILEQQQQPTIPEQQQQPTIPEQQQSTLQTNTEGVIDLNEIKNGDIDEFEQIKDVTPKETNKTNSETPAAQNKTNSETPIAQNKTTSEKVVIQSKTESNLKYPQTGTNNAIVIVGIIISMVVAVVSYKKMKNENKN